MDSRDQALLCDAYQVPIKDRHRDDCIVDRERYKLSKARNKNNFIPREDALQLLVEMQSQVDARGGARPRWVLYEAISEFQFGSGTRIGEECAVEFEDVLDWKTGAISISKTVQWGRKRGRPTRISPLTKNGEARVIYLSERALGALKMWKSHCGRSTGLIFSYDGVSPIGYTTIQRRYDAAFKKLGMKWRGTHIMRHSYATDFLEKTKDKTALQGQLGHLTSKQTDYYAKITRNAVRAGVSAYNASVRDSKSWELLPKFASENPELLGDAGRNDKAPRTANDSEGL